MVIVAVLSPECKLLLLLSAITCTVEGNPPTVTFPLVGLRVNQLAPPATACHFSASVPWLATVMLLKTCCPSGSFPKSSVDGLTLSWACLMVLAGAIYISTGHCGTPPFV